MTAFTVCNEPWLGRQGASEGRRTGRLASKTVISLVVLLCFVSGCGIDATPASSKTRYKLDILSRCIQGLMERESDVSKCRTIRDITKVSAENGLLLKEDYEDKRFETDGWGREFKVEVLNREGWIIVRLSSNGPDGTERDAGNGIHVEVRQRPDKTVEVLH